MWREHVDGANPNVVRSCDDKSRKLEDTLYVSAGYLHRCGRIRLMEMDTKSSIIKPSQVLIEWDAPERVFKTKPREFYRKTGVIIIFFAILLLIIKEFLIIGVLGIVFFVVYVFHTVPPKVVHHKITTNGLDYASEHLYMWSELVSFYLEKKDGADFLVLNTKNPIPGRILLLLDSKTNHQKLSEIINDYISIIEKPEITMMEKFMNEVSKKINF